MKTTKNTLAQRFAAKTTPATDGTGCLIWTGGKTRGGYGHFDGRRAHRVAWELAHGPVPAGLCVAHVCNNPACVHVKHLMLATPASNAAHRDMQGRQARGERHGRRRLDEVKVKAIREASGTLKEIAAKFGVSFANVGYIRRGQTWREQGASK